jgi:hypothetical protein
MKAEPDDIVHGFRRILIKRSLEPLPVAIQEKTSHPEPTQSPNRHQKTLSDLGRPYAATQEQLGRSAERRQADMELLELQQNQAVFFQHSGQHLLLPKSLTISRIPRMFGSGTRLTKELN